MIHNGSDVWAWASQRNEATHCYAADHGAAGRTPARCRACCRPAPAAGRRAGARGDRPDHRGDRRPVGAVAGRDAYELVLGAAGPPLPGRLRSGSRSTPRQHVPLRFEVFAKGSDDPAYQMAFTRGRLRPAGPGAVRLQPAARGEGHQQDARPPGPARRPDHASAAPRRPGPPSSAPAGPPCWSPAPSGRPAWSPQRQGATAGRSQRQLGAVLTALPAVSAAPGAAASCCRSELFTALLTDDGRVLIGAVTPTGCTR